MLLATVLVVGFIGMISSPSSIFAQEYYDDYEIEEYSQYYDKYETEYNNYESYMKDDNSRPIIQKINCDNINNNPPVNINVDLSDATNGGEASSSGDASQSFSNGDSQSGQRIDKMNADGFSDQKGDFVYTCVNNNNLNVNANIESTTNVNGNIESTTNFNTDEDIITIDQSNQCEVTQSNEAEQQATITDQSNNTISVEGGGTPNIERNNAIGQSITQSNEACTNTAVISPSADAGAFIPISADAGEDSGTSQIATVESSIATVEGSQPQTQQHVKLLQNGDGVEINKQGNLPIDIRQIKSSENDNGMEINQQGNLQIGKTQQLDSLSINDSPTISQETGDSPGLTAMEKTTKLKQQWLELLP